MPVDPHLNTPAPSPAHRGPGRPKGKSPGRPRNADRVVEAEGRDAAIKAIRLVVKMQSANSRLVGVANKLADKEDANINEILDIAERLTANAVEVAKSVKLLCEAVGLLGQTAPVEDGSWDANEALENLGIR